MTTTCEKAFWGNRSSARLGRGDLQTASPKSFEATSTAFFLARWKDWQQRGLSRIRWLHVPADYDLAIWGSSDSDVTRPFMGHALVSLIQPEIGTPHQSALGA